MDLFQVPAKAKNDCQSWRFATVMNEDSGGVASLNQALFNYFADGKRGWRE